jgi:hypothetical protein
VLVQPAKDQKSRDGKLLQTAQIEDGGEIDVLRGGFLHAANINTFSVCFNDGDKPGILRLGTELGENELVSMGKLHWGLGLSGVSVGNGVTGNQKPILCNAWEAPAQKKQMSTACGAVPDTGSTAIMAPKMHLLTLFENICNQWPRCVNFSQRLEGMAIELAMKGKDANAPPSANVQANYRLSTMLLQVGQTEEVAASSSASEPASDGQSPSGSLRASSFLTLLDNCDAWMKESNGTGLSELPDVNLQVKGEGGEPQTLSLAGFSYIYEVMEPDAARVRAPLRDIFPTEILNRTVDQNRKVCSPAFGAIEMTGHSSGPLWILGQPIFMQYQVGFSRGEPLKMSFTQIKSCTACSGENAVAKPATSPSLLQISEEIGEPAVSKQRSPRMIRGPLRFPSFDQERLEFF